jgi:hypothetical protein
VLKRSFFILTILGLAACSLYAASASARPVGKLLAYKVLSAKNGGVVEAADGAALKVPPNVMEHNSLVTVTRMRGGRYDMNIAGPWHGRVAVTLPRRKHRTGILHLVGSTWVQEAGAGTRTVWVTQLSPFSWVTDKLKAAACFKGDLRAIVMCLVSKGLSKIDSTLVKWLAEKAGVGDECAASLLASKGFVASLYTALISSACRGHAGLGDAEIGAGTFPSPEQPAPSGSSPGAAPPPSPPPSPPPTPSGGAAETTGGETHTWTNYTNAGGYEGPVIPAFTTVLVACKLTGFRVADGNTWWYRIASSPWNSAYYASADAFYNNGQTSGSLKGTPFVDPAVPNC